MADAPTTVPQTQTVTKPPVAAATPGPAITSANAPAPPHSDPLPVVDEQVIARPLTSPDFTSVVPVNPGIRFRWVNRIHGNEGRGGRFEEAKSSGFVPANEKDIKGVVSAHMKRDGCIIYGDLILMKIDRKLYDGALKYNEEQARRRVATVTMGQGRKELGQALNEVPGSRENKDKVKLYNPTL